MKKILLFSVLIILIVSAFVFSTAPAYASIFSDVVDTIKNALSGQSSQKLSITSQITLAPNGDINKNGQIDAGDTIKFTYTISNTTGNSYSFASLKTNTNTTSLNSLSNVQGAVSVNDENHTIIFPNLHINPNEQLTIHFDIHTNFNKDSNQTITTEPELLDQNNTSIAKGQKQEVIVNKMGLDAFNMFVHIAK